MDAEVTPVPEGQMVKEAASLSLSRFELTVTLDSESNPTLSSPNTGRLKGNRSQYDCCARYLECLFIDCFSKSITPVPSAYSFRKSPIPTTSSYTDSV